MQSEFVLTIHKPIKCSALRGSFRLC